MPRTARILRKARPANPSSTATSAWRPPGVLWRVNRTGLMEKFRLRAFRAPATAVRRQTWDHPIPPADEGTGMKILEHSESHIVKMQDGSAWQIFPGDIDQTLNWLPTN